MEGLGLAGMFTCLPPVRSGAVQIPEYTADRRRQQLAALTAGLLVPEVDAVCVHEPARRSLMKLVQDP